MGLVLLLQTSSPLFYFPLWRNLSQQPLPRADDPAVSQSHGRKKKSRASSTVAREDVVSAAVVQDKCGAAAVSFHLTRNH